MLNLEFAHASQLRSANLLGAQELGNLIALTLNVLLWFRWQGGLEKHVSNLGICWPNLFCFELIREYNFQPIAF